MEKRKTVIIGGVAGGASTAARLRRLDKDREIIMIERGDYISFANCGLPYHIGEVIEDREDLLIMTPELMKERFEIDVRIRHEVIKINKEEKKIIVKNIDDNLEYEETYDDLVIATGSSPLRPRILGIESNKILTLSTIFDMDRIKDAISKSDIKDVAVIGGGFIGLEMADNLHEANKNVTIIEALNQVMAPLDYEMAQIIHENILDNGVKLYLNDGVSSFEEEDKVKIVLNSGKEIEVDLVILAIGVRANSNVAKDAGLEINERGGIVVNEHMQTSDPNIYAVGDVIEVVDYIFKDKTMIPLAGPANKQGRILADNLAGINSTYKGTQGSSIAKIFDLTAASTGANEKALMKHNLVKDKDYYSIIIRQNSHASYYPGALEMTIKLLFSTDGKKIYGAQIVGREGVDKRIDVLATAIRLNATIDDLKELELAYAPPYSSAKDPVNMAGFVAENVINGLVKIAAYDEYDNDADKVLLDVREDYEYEYNHVEGSIHIPLGQLRKSIKNLDKEKSYIILCAVGVRAYNAARIMLQNGFKEVSVYPAGISFYQTTHKKI